MLDADIIAIEPSFDGFRVDGTTYRGLDTLSEHSSARYKEAKDRWKSQIEAALLGGKSVFVCQTAFKRDPLSASKRDPLFGYDAG